MLHGLLILSKKRFRSYPRCRRGALPKWVLRTFCAFETSPENRAGEIRTRDLLNPIQALYQAEPRPVTE